MYQYQVDVLDMLNAVKSVLADVSSVSPSSLWSLLCRSQFSQGPVFHLIRMACRGERHEGVSTSP